MHVHFKVSLEVSTLLTHLFKLQCMRDIECITLESMKKISDSAEMRCLFMKQVRQNSRWKYHEIHISSACPYFMEQ
jgi:hypothetical protein